MIRIISDSGKILFEGDRRDYIQEDIVYTIGHTESYDKGIEERNYAQQLNKEDTFRKLGKTETYDGGIIFIRIRDAQTYLKNINKEIDYSVYEIKADWDKDCYNEQLREGLNTKLLLNNSSITRKVFLKKK